VCAASAAAAHLAVTIFSVALASTADCCCAVPLAAAYYRLRLVVAAWPLLAAAGRFFARSRRRTRTAQHARPGQPALHARRA